MTLLQLGYVMEVANTGSINKASKNLFVSQSSISSAIRELEEETGITIFHRTNRGVEFTDDGRTFYAYIRPIVEQQRKVMDLYTGKKPSSILRLSVSTQHYPFSAQAFVLLVQNLDTSMYSLRLNETGIQDILEEVTELQSDLGILFFSAATQQFLKRTLALREMEFHPLKRVPPKAFLGAHHPLAGQDCIQVDQLGGYPFVVFDQDRSTSVNFSEEVLPTGFSPSHRIIYVNDRNTVYNVLAHTDAFSLGTGLLPHGFCDYNIVAVPIHSPSDNMQLGWVKLKNRELSPIARQYVHLLEQCLLEEPGNGRDFSTQCLDD